MTVITGAPGDITLTDYWREMVTVALLGTDRRDPPVPPKGGLADLAADDPQRCVLIDANADADAVAASVWAALRDHVFAAPSPADTA